MEQPELSPDLELQLPPKKQMWKNLFHLSWPVAVELFLASLIGIVSGRLVAELSNGSIFTVERLFTISNTLLSTFCIGGTALLARSLGNKDSTQAAAACEQTLFLSISISVIYGIPLLMFGGGILSLMGATRDERAIAELYMHYYIIGFLFQAISTAVSALVRGAGRTVLSMQFNVVANIVNLGLGYLLANGFGPIPSLGIQGVAIAQLVARIVGCVLALWILFRPGKLSVHPNIKKIFVPKMSIISRICEVGAPFALESLILQVGLYVFMGYFSMRNPHSSSYLSSDSLAYSERFTYLMAISFHQYVIMFGNVLAVASISLVGQNLGAGRPGIAEKYLIEALKQGLLLSAILIIALLAFPQYIARIHSSDPETVMAVRICAILVVPTLIYQILYGGLRGGGDTIGPLIATGVGLLCMRILLAYFLIVQWQWGLAGVVCSWTLDLSSRAIIIYFRFKSGKWKTVRV